MRNEKGGVGRSGRAGGGWLGEMGLNSANLFERGCSFVRYGFADRGLLS